MCRCELRPGLAYERELQAALQELERSFVDWRSNKISPFDLNDKIHEHHDGVSRELWIRYTNHSTADFQVEMALNSGILKQEEISAELREALENKRVAPTDFER